MTAFRKGKYKAVEIRPFVFCVKDENGDTIGSNLNFIEATNLLDALTPDVKMKPFKPIKVKGKPLSEQIVEDRR